LVSRSIQKYDRKFTFSRKSITLIGYGFIGVELIVITAGEAKYPRRDLPKASRRVYLVTILLYLFSAILIAFNVPFTDPNLLSLSDTNIDDVTGARSPYIIAINNAGIKVLPSFINACFLFAAWTAG
jgi:yeast amino acid transporter